MSEPIDAPRFVRDGLELDDVTVPLGHDAVFRAERMDDHVWWVAVTRADGKAISFNFSARTSGPSRDRRAELRLLVQEDGVSHQKAKRRRGPCGRCGACDGLRFRAWRARVEAPLTGSADDEESDRFKLIEEIHRDRSGRHPLGIAQRLSEVIDALHVDEDDVSAIVDLGDLEHDERRAIELNGERNLGCCAPGAKSFRGAAS